MMYGLVVGQEPIVYIKKNSGTKNLPFTVALSREGPAGNVGDECRIDTYRLTRSKTAGHLTGNQHIDDPNLKGVNTYRITFRS